MSDAAKLHGDAAEIPADDPRVQYEGRVATAGSGAVRLAFPGIVTRLRVNGPHLALRCLTNRDDTYMDVSVDGDPHERVRLTNGEQTVELIRDNPGEHVVELVRRTESWQGTWDFIAFEAQDGTFEPPAPLPERKLMFIGDSITCGEATDIRDGDPDEGSHTANARLSYGYRVARRLQAQCHLVAYGGRGLIRDWEGNRDTNNAPQFYERTLPDDASSRWDHAKYVPDAVGVCLGVNDFNQGILDEDEYVDAYVAFVRRIRENAPDAVILLIESPMYGEGSEGRVALSRYIRETRAALDDDRVLQLEIGYYPGRPENAHPVASEHAAMADEVEPVLRSALGW